MPKTRYSFHYQNLSKNSNTSQNIKIKNHLTPSGLLFVTLSEDTPSFEDFFEGLEQLTNKVDFTKLPHRRSISYEGNFNWKTMYVSFYIDNTLTFSGLTGFKNVFTVNIVGYRGSLWLHIEACFGGMRY